MRLTRLSPRSTPPRSSSVRALNASLMMWFITHLTVGLSLPSAETDLVSLTSISTWSDSNVSLIRSASARPRPKGRDRERAHEHEHDRTHEHARDGEHSGSESSRELSQESLQVSTLFEIDRKILTLSRQRRSTQVKLDELNAQGARYQAEIAELDQLLHVDSTALMKLLTLRERVKPARVIELLISSDGPLEQKRREVYLAALFRSGARRLRALSLAKQRLGARRRAAQLLERRARDLKRVLDEQSAQLAAERRAEWEVISSHRARTSRAGGVDAQEISHWERSNQLPPTQGRWIDEFRSFRGLSLAKLYGSGVWILNQSGAPVYSVAPGRVIFSGEVKGWGGVVIAQHDLDYLSIYANLSQVTVKTGARVRAQQRLGDSGDEAGREGLYFELRRGGQPIHPERLIDRELLRTPLHSPPSP